MIAWQEIHQQHLAGNENAAHNIINELNIWANENADLDGRREVVNLLGAMNETVREVRRVCDEHMIEMRQMMENQIRNLQQDIRNLQYFLAQSRRLHNEHILMMVQQPPPAPLYTKEELCTEILEQVDDSKETMSDQTYIDITQKLMEIYRR